jgi:hypothetical protein
MSTRLKQGLLLLLLGGGRASKRLLASREAFLMVDKAGFIDISGTRRGAIRTKTKNLARFFFNRKFREFF